jgi:hypothetical protein
MKFLEKFMTFRRMLVVITIVIVLVFAGIAGVCFAVFGGGVDENIGLDSRANGAAGLINDQTSLQQVGDGDYDFTEARDHIGEKAKVRGKVSRVFTAKSGVTFLDFCPEFSGCPFSAVIFAGDTTKFGDLMSYERDVIVSGIIKSYQGSAEIILNDPSQIEKFTCNLSTRLT